jgi:hypothetical protein
MSRVSAIAFLIVSLVFVGGCTWQESGGSDQTVGTSQDSLSLAPSWAWRIRGWKTHLQAAVTTDPNTVYPTPSPALFRKRLAQASSRYHFQVVSLRFVHAPQGSPLLIVQSASPSAFSRDTAAIMGRLDPQHGGGPGWDGWAYEGFFMGAQDSNGRPFLAAFNTLRVHSGGQWARTERLLPFPHG